MIVESRLPDGTRALILPLLPQDREALSTGYDHLSDESRVHRFMAGVPHLTDAMLAHLVDEVDGVDHVALALVTINDDDVGTPAGVARIIRYPEAPTTADVAVTVVDEWQGRGVAGVLLAELLQARPHGVTQLVTRVAGDNPASLAMLRRLGPTTITDAGDGTFEVVVDLAATAALH